MRHIRTWIFVVASFTKVRKLFVAVWIIGTIAMLGSFMKSPGTFLSSSVLTEREEIEHVERNSAYRQQDTYPVYQQESNEGTNQEQKLNEGTNKEQVTTDEQRRLRIYIEQVEARYLASLRARRNLVLVRGNDKVIDRDLPLYKDALLKRGYGVEVETTTGIPWKGYNTSDKPEKKEDWLSVICMSFTDGETDCMQRENYTDMTPGQTINRIPGIRKSLWRKDGLCRTMNAVRHIPVLRDSNLSPLCYNLPEQQESFQSISRHTPISPWIIKSVLPAGSIHLLSPTRQPLLRTYKYSKTQPSVVQQYISNPLLVKGLPFSMRAFVLVTSFSPLRAYIHSEGLVQFRYSYERNFKKIPGKTWSFSQLRRYAMSKFNMETARVMWRNMESVIIQTLLAAELTVVQHYEHFGTADQPYDCSHCFQLLGIDLIFNSSFHPSVVEVNGQPHMQEGVVDVGLDNNDAKRNAVEDLVSLVFSTTPVASDVTKALLAVAPEQKIVEEFGCGPNPELCLTNKDILRLLHSRREVINKGNFQLLYPTPGGNKYSILMQQLHDFNQKLAGSSPHDNSHGTYTIHAFMSKLATYYSNIDSTEDVYSDESTEAVEFSNEQPPETLVENIFINKTQSKDKYVRHHCEEDLTSLSLLSGIFTEPAIALNFSPTVYIYDIEVAYDVQVVKIWAFAMNCHCEARTDSKIGPTSPTNYTLGLGTSTIALFVVDVSHTNPWIVNRYLINIHRRARGHHLGMFQANDEHVVCQLRHTCDLMTSNLDSCGLQPTEHLSWRSSFENYGTMPLCESGNVPGGWLVPCREDCSDDNNCYWGEARWQPDGCSYEILNEHQTQSCLDGKKVLFLGDSTNRGIMHYMMEAVNGTLTQIDKSHGIVVYNNLNFGRTSMAFAYYPQFWQPDANKRSLADTLTKLVQMAGPLNNNSNTVLVVGGVSWLMTKHFPLIISALNRIDLQGIKLVIKSMGTTNIEKMDVSEAIQHNAELTRCAQLYGLEVIQTFPMVLSRYKDFLQGKCACHFHKIKEIHSDKQVVQDSSSNKFQHLVRGQTSLNDHVTYHVDGDVNAAYSNILLNMLCQHKHS
ncbi:unnamed protein product [Owenia fusiformis]|uniref:Cadherin-like and PC-esterase domain-containing protein 1 n=1 Tax=Owenia fusiformis TaxID=6347 RepID=A0A8J1T6R5_OWEFU|nr:unnamed protein product [Owenia fusiformis]